MDLRLEHPRRRSIRTNVAVSAGAVACLLAAVPAAAKQRIFSYDAATPVTRTLAEGGFTFVVDDGTFGGQKVRKLLSTTDSAEAELKPAPESALGGAMDALAGHHVDGRDLYEVLPANEGAPLIRAACPGSDKAWLAFGRLRRIDDLRVEAFGLYPGHTDAHLCATLDFSWRGEWKLPDRPPSRRPDTTPSPSPR